MKKRIEFRRGDISEKAFRYYSGTSQTVTEENGIYYLDGEKVGTLEQLDEAFCEYEDDVAEGAIASLRWSASSLRLEYAGGESRYSVKACDYMIVIYTDPEGVDISYKCLDDYDLPEFYAEVVRDDEWNEEDEDKYEDDLAAEIRDQMAAYGLPASFIDKVIVNRGKRVEI